jgi:probable HAF family extracellular repeat protein
MANLQRPGHLSRRAFSFPFLAAALAPRLKAQSTSNAIYDPVDLGPLRSYDSYTPCGMNQLGQITGNAIGGVINGGEAFLWTPGGTGGDPANPQMKGLGTLSGPGEPEWWDNGSMAFAINNSGMVVGTADGTGRLVDSAHGCLWRPDGSTIDLGTLMDDNAMNSMAHGINDIGKIAGVRHRIRHTRLVQTQARDHLRHTKPAPERSRPRSQPRELNQRLERDRGRILPR